jgi:quinol monooxygenase YgiN
MSDDPELAVITAVLEARPGDEDELAAVLARYAVVARGEPGCRNLDLLVSATHGGRFVMVSKWDSPAAARAHLDARAMTEMAESAVPLLARRPDIDLLDTISAHDLA